MIQPTAALLAFAVSVTALAVAITAGTIIYHLVRSHATTTGGGGYE